MEKNSQSNFIQKEWVYEYFFTPRMYAILNEGMINHPL